jgi:hypothetical protein
VKVVRKNKQFANFLSTLNAYIVSKDNSCIVLPVSNDHYGEHLAAVTPRGLR